MFIHKKPHTEKHMSDHTATPNGATSLAFESQSLIKSHVDRMVLFHSSKILKDC